MIFHRSRRFLRRRSNHPAAHWQPALLRPDRMGNLQEKLLFMRPKTCQIMWAKQSSPCQKWYKPSPVMGGLCLFIPTWYRFLHFLKNSKESLDDSLFFSWGPYSSTSWEDRLSEKCDIQDNWRALLPIEHAPLFIYIYIILYIYIHDGIHINVHINRHIYIIYLDIQKLHFLWSRPKR